MIHHTLQVSVAAAPAANGAAGLPAASGDDGSGAPGSFARALDAAATGTEAAALAPTPRDRTDAAGAMAARALSAKAPGTGVKSATIAADLRLRHAAPGPRTRLDPPVTLPVQPWPGTPRVTATAATATLSAATDRAEADPLRELQRFATAAPADPAAAAAASAGAASTLLPPGDRSDAAGATAAQAAAAAVPDPGGDAATLRADLHARHAPTDLRARLDAPASTPGQPSPGTPLAAAASAAPAATAAPRPARVGRPPDDPARTGPAPDPPQTMVLAPSEPPDTAPVHHHEESPASTAAAPDPALPRPADPVLPAPPATGLQAAASAPAGGETTTASPQRMRDPQTPAGLDGTGAAAGMTHASTGATAPLGKAAPAVRPTGSEEARPQPDPGDTVVWVDPLSAAAAPQSGSRGDPVSRPAEFGAAPPASPALAPSGSTPAPAATAPLAEGRLAASPGSAEFGYQLGAQLTTFVREGVQHARLHLHPAELGPVTVRIQLEGQAAQVHLAADNAFTRQALEQSMPQLAGNLREAGLTLSGGGVFEQPRQRDDGASGQSGSPPRRPVGDGSALEPVLRSVAAAAARRGVVDLVA